MSNNKPPPPHPPTHPHPVLCCAGDLLGGSATGGPPCQVPQVHPTHRDHVAGHVAVVHGVYSFVRAPYATVEVRWRCCVADGARSARWISGVEYSGRKPQPPPAGKSGHIYRLVGMCDHIFDVCISRVFSPTRRKTEECITIA
jgi:hypothetical protein